MVNVGGPSAGCDLCRKRRVKCDQDKPGCRNCARYGHVCPGYTANSKNISRTGVAGRAYTWQRTPAAPTLDSSKTVTSSPTVSSERTIAPSSDGADTQVEEEVDGSLKETQAFADQGDDELQRTSPTLSCVLSRALRDTIGYSDIEVPSEEPAKTTSTLVRVARGPRKRVRDDHSRADHKGHPLPVSASPRYTITRLPPQQLLDLSICYFFTAGLPAIFQSIGPEIDYRQIIKQMYASTAPDSSLRHALNANAMVDYCNRFRPEKCEQAVLAEYGRSIVALNAALQDPELHMKNETLMAVNCVALYEFYAGMNPRWIIKHWLSHSEGVRALLRTKSASITSTPTGKWLFTFCQLGSNWVALLSAQSGANDALYVLEDQIFLENADSSYPVRALARSYFNGVTMLQARASLVLGSEVVHQGNISELMALSCEIETLDLGVSSWCDMSEDWQRKPIHENPQVSSSTLMAVHYYSSFMVFLHHLMVLVAQIKLHETAIRLLRTQLRMTYIVDAAKSSHVSSMFTNKIAAYADTIRTNLSAFLGSLAYAMGDVDEDGQPTCGLGPQSESSSATAGTRLRSMEIFVPLAALQSCEFIDQIQLVVVQEVLQRIQDEFRQRRD